MIYEWGSFRRFNVDAQLVGETVEKLSAETGVCPPWKFVKAVSDPQSPLHDLLTWEDKEAADKYRVHEARRIIGSLRVVIEESDSRPPAFVHVKISSGDLRGHEGYADTMRVVLDPELRAQAIDEALRSLNGLRRRYDSLTELGPVWDALDAVSMAEAS